MIINLPKLGPVRFDDGLSPEEFNKQLGLLAKQYDFKVPKPDVGIGTLLKRGFMRGVGETGIALGRLRIILSHLNLIDLLLNVRLKRRHVVRVHLLCRHSVLA